MTTLIAPARTPGGVPLPGKMSTFALYKRWFDYCYRGIVGIPDPIDYAEGGALWPAESTS